MKQLQPYLQPVTIFTASRCAEYVVRTMADNWTGGEGLWWV